MNFKEEAFANMLIAARDKHLFINVFFSDHLSASGLVTKIESGMVTMEQDTSWKGATRELWVRHFAIQDIVVIGYADTTNITRLF